MRFFRLAACLKCRGDLVYDEGDWLCLQCGVYYYTRLHARAGLPDDGRLRIAASRDDPFLRDDNRPARKAG